MAKKGHKAWNKGLKTGMAPWRGKKLSEDTKKKLSYVRKENWKNGKERQNKGNFKKGQLAWNKGNGEYMSREKHWNWQGGITSTKDKLRNSLEYQEWRAKVFLRDNFTCQLCNQVGGELEAHHIKSFAFNPELIFEVSNGITLCKECHRLTDNYCGRCKK